MNTGVDLFGVLAGEMLLPLDQCSGPYTDEWALRRARRVVAILPQTVAAAARAPVEETEGGALIDREVAIELRRVNQKIRKLALDRSVFVSRQKEGWDGMGWSSFCMCLVVN
jgi:hypothetical protein